MSNDYERGRAEEYGRTVQERERWDTLLKAAESEVERLKHPNADEILASIEDFAERRELDFIDQRDRAIKAKAEVARLRAALGEAAMSMETIADGAGSGLLLEMSQVRGYARSRAAVARAALRGEGEK